MNTNQPDIEYQLTPKAMEMSKQISNTTKDTVVDLVGKFTGDFGKKKTKTATKQKSDNTFVAKAKIVQDGKTASKKIKPLDGDNQLTDMLLKIYGFLNKNYQQDKLYNEQKNNFKEELELEASKRHQLLIAELEKIRKDYLAGLANMGYEDGSVGSFNFPNIPGLDRPKGGDKSRPGAGGKGKASKITRGVDSKGREYFKDEKGKFVSKKTATKATGYLGKAKKILGFLKKVPILSSIAAGATMITEISDAINANEAGEITDEELRRKIAQEIGAAMGGIGGAEIGGIIGTAVGGPIGAAIGGVAGFMAGEKLGSYVGDKIFDYIEEGGQPNPVAKPGEGGAPGVSVTGEVDLSGPVSEPAPKTTPISTPKSSKLNQVTSENLDNKLNNLVKKSSDPEVNTINTSAPIQTSSRSFSGSMPPVRNQEESFQRMIVYSTRVV